MQFCNSTSTNSGKLVFLMSVHIRKQIICTRILKKYTVQLILSIFSTDLLTKTKRKKNPLILTPSSSFSLISQNPLQLVQILTLLGVSKYQLLFQNLSTIFISNYLIDCNKNYVHQQYFLLARGNSFKNCFPNF